MKKNDLTDIKVGDRLWGIHLTEGWGTVKKIDPEVPYPIKMVDDYGNTTIYTKEGYRFDNDQLPSLFWDAIIIDYPNKPVPELPVDAKMTVWVDDAKHKRHFSHFKDGKCYCFDLGATSWSTTLYTGWDHWEVYEENPANTYDLKSH